MHIQKGYVYFAMGFSVSVEMLNIHAGKQAAVQTMKLRKALEEDKIQV